MQDAGAVGADLDAGAQLAQLGRLLVDGDVDAVPYACQRRRKAADARAYDCDRGRHGRAKESKRDAPLITARGWNIGMSGFALKLFMMSSRNQIAGDRACSACWIISGSGWSSTARRRAILATGGTDMKITSYESATLNITEDDPLANMPEEAGRTRPIVILRLRTDDGI